MRLLLWASFAIGAVLSVIAQVHTEEEQLSTIPVVVGRRLSGDAYTTLQQDKINVIHCPADNATYLVIEKLCINNHYLLNECLLLVTPVGEFSTPRLLLNIDMAGNSTIAQTINTNNQVADAVVTFRSREEQVNSSICEISALEVYRGREQATNISHQGFSLTENSTIKIHIDQLVYRFEEYEGELYRLYLSCSDGGLPEGGCLFFKVFGSTNISEAKFNCSVPGTLPTDSSKCMVTTVELTTSPPTSPISIMNETTLIVTSLNTVPTTSFESNNNNILFIAPFVGGVTILAVCIMMPCVVFWFQRRKKQLNSVSNVAAQQNEDTAVTLESNTCQRNPAYIQLGPVDGSQTDLVSGSYSENPAYNIDAQQSSHQEPTYEVIPSDTDTTPCPVQGTQNINYNQNPAYIHLGIHVEECFQAHPSPCDYSQNPAYGIHSNSN